MAKNDTSKTWLCGLCKFRSKKLLKTTPHIINGAQVCDNCWARHHVPTAVTGSGPAQIQARQYNASTGLYAGQARCQHCDAKFMDHPGKKYCDVICKQRAKEKRKRQRAKTARQAAEVAA